MPYSLYNYWLNRLEKTMPSTLIGRLEPWRTSRFPLGLLSDALWQQTSNYIAAQESDRTTLPDLRQAFQDTTLGGVETEKARTGKIGNSERSQYLFGPDTRTEAARDQIVPWFAAGADAVPNEDERRAARGFQTVAFSGPPASKPEDDPNLQRARGGAPISGERSVYERLQRLTPEQLENLGYPLFGEMWRQYRGGTGGDAWIPERRLHSYPWIRETQDRLHNHFVSWMLDTHEKKLVPHGRGLALEDPGFEQIKDILTNMKDGESISRSSKWTGIFGVNAGKSGLEDIEKKVPLALERWGVLNPSPEGDLTGALGRSNIAADGAFTFERKGDRIHFRGLVTNNIDDPFDFDPRQDYPMVDEQSSFRVPGTTFVRLEKSGAAKQFRVKSNWRETASGTLLVKPNGSIELDSIRWTPLKQPRGPR
jgi:hypothetical protein